MIICFHLTLIFLCLCCSRFRRNTTGFSKMCHAVLRLFCQSVNVFLIKKEGKLIFSSHQSVLPGALLVYSPSFRSLNTNTPSKQLYLHALICMFHCNCNIIRKMQNRVYSQTERSGRSLLLHL